MATKAPAQFQLAQVVLQDTVTPLEIWTVDVDADLDIVELGYDGWWPHGLLRWFPNDGTGLFGTGLLLFDSLRTTDVADLDGDGAVDLLLKSSGTSYAFEWSRNMGGGAFDPPQGIGAGIIATDLEPTDVDGDLDNDVVVQQGQDLHTYLNDGSGVFSDFSATSLPAGYSPVHMRTAIWTAMRRISGHYFD
ncbi:MAG: VCBS repeat-containing protein [Flavobacteriales bacterium]|nr:VCBS repeat-containing protein [Flavobacteriales bacterium]